MHRSWISYAAFVATLVSVALVGGNAAAAPSGHGCSFVAASQLRSILGVGHIAYLKDLPGTSAPDNTAGVTHSVCTGVGWSGSQPSSPAASLAALRRGRAAAFAVETWAPDDVSQYVGKWTDTTYDTMTGVGLIQGLALPMLPFGQRHQVRTLHPPGNGWNAIGLTAVPMSGVLTAGGAWWNDSTYSIVGIAIAQSSSRPVVKNLNKIAGIVITNFGL